MKECILVGNATFNYELGTEIDSYDYVVRFNRFRIDGYEKYVGTRCTHWVLNNKLTTDSRDYYRKHIDSKRKTHPEFIETYVLTNSGNQKDILDGIKKSYPNFDYHISTLKLNGKKGIYWSSWDILFLEKFEKISIVGFDFGNSNHYWGNHGPSDVPGGHAWNAEREYVAKLIESNKVTIF